MALRINVANAASTPPATSHGVRLPMMTRVWSENVEMSGVTTIDSTAPSAMTTASGVARTVFAAIGAEDPSVLSPIHQGDVIGGWR